MDAGFILALQFNHGDLEPDCVGVSMGEGGFMRRIKIPGIRFPNKSWEEPAEDKCATKAAVYSTTTNPLG